MINFFRYQGNKQKKNPAAFKYIWINETNKMNGVKS